jgi:hypothetical protein
VQGGPTHQAVVHHDVRHVRVQARGLGDEAQGFDGLGAGQRL